MRRTAPLKGLGPLESRIMELLWEQGESTVRSVAERLTYPRRPAYTTVMTIMSRLVEKGLLRRRSAGRAYVYRPAKTREEFLAAASRSRVRELVRDYGDVALAHFVREIEQADGERLKRLAGWLERRDERGRS